MSTNRLDGIVQLNIDDRIEVLMKKESQLPDQVGRFKHFHFFEDESDCLQYLVIEEDSEFKNEKTISFVSLKFIERIRKLPIH